MSWKRKERNQTKRMTDFYSQPSADGFPSKKDRRLKHCSPDIHRAQHTSGRASQSSSCSSSPAKAKHKLQDTADPALEVSDLEGSLKDTIELQDSISEYPISRC